MRKRVNEKANIRLISRYSILNDLEEKNRLTDWTTG